MLFSLAASIRASTIIEIGRCKGFSALALAGALALLDDQEWRDPQGFYERPDVDYKALYGQKPRRLYSLDPVPDPDAASLLSAHGLLDYVTLIDRRSQDAVNDPAIPGGVDLVFIDGDHAEDMAMADVNHYVPRLRPGGIFALHDHFGWYVDGINRSPVKSVCDNLIRERFTEHLLIDTGGPSLHVFRKPVAA